MGRFWTCVRDGCRSGLLFRPSRAGEDGLGRGIREAVGGRFGGAETVEREHVWLGVQAVRYS